MTYRHSKLRNMRNIPNFIYKNEKPYVFTILPISIEGGAPYETIAA